MNGLLYGLPTKVLTAQEERKYARTARGRTRLVLHTMREAFWYARKCCRAGLGDDVIYSVCYAALRASVRCYKPSKGRFFPFCKVNVRGQISREWKRQNVVKHSDQHESLDVDPQPLEGAVIEPEFGLMEIHERLELVNPILRSKLTRHEQQIIELRYRAGCNFTKIGKLFGLSRQRIELMHREALLKVKRELIRRGRL